jgi:hypothetical protein
MIVNIIGMAVPSRYLIGTLADGDSIRYKVAAM